MLFFSKTTILVVVAPFLFAITTTAQNSNSNHLRSTDQQLGSSSLPYANGKLHLNYDITITPDNHRYFGDNQFVKGNLVYKGESYYDLKLKYDIKEDELVYLPEEDNNYIKVNLIREYVDAFTLNAKKFQNLSKVVSSKFEKGYYEVALEYKGAVLYLKHSKNAIEILKNNKKEIEYFAKKEYLLFYNGNYSLIESERDFQQFFPEKKETIQTYFEKFQKLEKSNKTEFISNLLQQLI